MGNYNGQSQVSIIIKKPISPLFDFHQQNIKSENRILLSYPSFIKNNNKIIEYAQRCKFTDRQYEIDYLQKDGVNEIILKKQPTTKEILWRSLLVDQTVLLQQGSNIKIGDRQFTIKKICQNFNDIDDYDEDLRTFQDISSIVNLDNSQVRNYRSRRLQRSKYLSKVDSLSNVNSDIEGQFCRVCLGRQSTQTNPLLSLCKCSGSVKNIHYGCLKSWINAKSKHISCGSYEYFEYNLSCDLCKQKIDKVITHNNKKYAVYSQTFMHPPYIVLSTQQPQKSNQVKEYIINFDHKQTILIGKSKKCDLPINSKFISPQHCQLTYEANNLYLRNLNPQFGTFTNFTYAEFTSKQKQVSLMINNHIVVFTNEESQSCCFKDTIKIKLETES